MNQGVSKIWVLMKRVYQEDLIPLHIRRSYVLRLLRTDTYFFTAFSFLIFLDFLLFPASSVDADDVAGMAGGASPVVGGATPGGYIGGSCWFMANPGTPGGGGVIPGGGI